MTVNEYKQLASALGVGRGQLDEGFQDQGFSQYREPMYLSKDAKAVKPYRLDDMSWLNPKGSKKFQATIKKVWADMSPEERRERTRVLRINGAQCGGKKKRTVRKGQTVER